jgi:glycosyltransferase involved in cell wall biosynthesis
MAARHRALTVTMLPASALRLHSEIESPRPLGAGDGLVSVQGWCFFSELPDAPTVRLCTTAGSLPMTTRAERPDVAGLFPQSPAARHSGFIIQGRLPCGVYLARFEALAPDESWHCFRELTLAVPRAAFRAALDTPIATGTLRDRVKVGGWALQPGESLTALSLRYGHRDLPCVLNRPREDVPVKFPNLPHAAQSGFISSDFLVAGHGPVRLRGQLADGSIVIASTAVTFSIDRDENHEPELDLAATRVGLTRGEIRPPPTPVRSGHPLNICFVLHGSFASNSALHVAGLANELAAAGHACAVVVPHDLDTLAHHTLPAFRGLSFAEAESSLIFPDGRGPDIIHAWTTREHVRRLALMLRTRHGAKLVIHLEDHEQEILELSTGRRFSELTEMSEKELAAILPPELSHPRHGPEFLAGADAVTVIAEPLRKFVPAHLPTLLVWPAADSRYFYPRARPDNFRRILDLAPDATVLFYHGNVHAANAAEMRELYLAVLQLNQAGLPVTLIRTGLDSVDFLGPLAAECAPHVLALGQITHHRHLPDLMALADVFVQPGAADAFNDHRFPSKLPEFFAIGRPVVLPRTNLGHQVRHRIDAYVLDRADAAGIAGAIRELRSDPALCTTLAEGALAFARRHFDWGRSAGALANFYRSLTDS